MMFKVKVCGITRVSDAKTAVSCGADMIGMISYRKSPRFVTPKLMSAIAASIPPAVDKVLVAVGDDFSALLAVARKLRFEYVQWHGVLEQRDILKAHAFGIKVIATVSNPTAQLLLQMSRTHADLLLLDNADHRAGGTGKQFDWRVPLPKDITNIVLAGGITSENVSKGVRLFSPMVVDVNSGVESRPGIKSPNKIKQFFNVCNVIRYGTAQ